MFKAHFNLCLWEENKRKTHGECGRSSLLHTHGTRPETATLGKSNVCVPHRSYVLQQLCVSRGAHDMRTNWKVTERRPTFYQLASSKAQPAWEPGPQFLKEKKQTLDMPLRLDSGKNLVGLCSGNSHKLIIMR